MSNDYREGAADYYDRYASPPPGDIDFYRARICGNSRVLELGCGTGRVLLPLAESAGYVHGLDLSPAMLATCQRKLEDSGIGESRALAEEADISEFDLTDRMPKFDLIIAPFRVIQNLETDAQVAGLMDCIRRHLGPNGEAILNTFCPRGDPEKLKALWGSRDGSEPSWTKVVGDETVTLTEVCDRYRDDPLTVYPDLIYRRHDSSGDQVDEAILSVLMRVWYPEQLIDLIESNGFEITGRFGGYQGETWGEGSELVVCLREGGGVDDD